MLRILFCLSFLLCHLAAGQDAQAESSVVKLDSKQFAEQVPVGNHFVMFYAPWYDD